MRKFVLFDFDDVIANTELSNTHYIAKALALYGITMTEEDMYSLIGNNGGKPIIDLLEKYHAPVDYEGFMKTRRSLGNTYENGELNLNPGLGSLLEDLKKAGVRMAVVSSTSEHLVLKALERLKITDYFEEVICGNRVPERKPSPVPYQIAMQKMGAKPEECIVIEDSEPGIKAGKASGAFVIGYEGSSLKHNTSEADLSIEHFDQIRKLDLGLPL